MSETVIIFDRWNALGSYGKCPEDGKNVYLHRDAYIKPSLRESYLCRLEPNCCGLFVKNYFAIPLELVPVDDAVGVGEPTMLDCAESADDEVKAVYSEEPDGVIPVPECSTPPSLEKRVMYLGGNTLGSSFFVGEYCRLLRSMDGKILTIANGSSSGIPVKGNKVSADGIDTILGGGVRELAFTVSGNEMTIVIEE